MKTKVLTLRHIAALGTGLLMTALVPGIASATIVGSGHDLSAVAAGTTDQICIYCHTPHNADTTVTDAPLWNHEVATTAGYTMYTGPSGTLNAVTASSPTGISRLCMSCHDGTLAVDSYGGLTGNVKIGSINANADFGTDLSNDHPISFTYDDALATEDGELFAPSTETVAVGSGSFTQSGTIQTVLLFSDVMECASCHDVHNTQVSSTGLYMLRDEMASSELCLNCHNK